MPHYSLCHLPIRVPAVRERRRADEAEARAAGAEAVNAGAAMEMQAMRGTAVCV